MLAGASSGVGKDNSYPRDFEALADRIYQVQQDLIILFRLS